MLTPSDLRALRLALSEAEDSKIRRIVALLDRPALPEAAQAILDPLRPRLAMLRPPRSLRFARLLFMPLDPLIVRSPDWRPGAPAIPRGGLVPMALTVYAALQEEAAEIEAMIAGRDTDDDAAVQAAGDRLWPRAAAILSAIPHPADWDTTGMPASVYPALACAIAAVLLRTSRLRDIAREAKIGALEPDDEAVRGILAGLSEESPEGFGMVVALLLTRLPNAAARIQGIIASSRGSAGSASLRQAMDSAVDAMLTRMESANGFDAGVRDAPLRSVGQEVQRIVTLLRDIDSEPDAARHRPRLKAIRAQLDEACRARFGNGLREGLSEPLSAADQPVTGLAQTGLETSARELRGLQMAARKIGDPSVYDTLLAQGAEIVSVAAEAGVLTPVRQSRLVEIMAGPEAAEALLKQRR